jgi:hypothetical protein
LIGHSDFNVAVQGGNLNLEIRSSRGYRLKKSAAINAAFELMPTGKGETEESILACASGRRPLVAMREFDRWGRRGPVEGPHRFKIAASTFLDRKIIQETRFRA